MQLTSANPCKVYGDWTGAQHATYATLLREVKWGPDTYVCHVMRVNSFVTYLLQIATSMLIVYRACSAFKLPTKPFKQSHHYDSSYVIAGTIFIIHDRIDDKIAVACTDKPTLVFTQF
jgi:hypothetical protein